MCFHPTDPNLLISAGWDETIQFWDIRAGGSIKSIFGPRVSGDSLDFNPVNGTILAGSWRGHDNVEIWFVNSNKTLQI